MAEDILNYLYQLSCFVGHPVSININCPVSLFVCISDHNSETPLTDLPQPLVGELGRTTGRLLARLEHSKLSVLTFTEKNSFQT